MKLELDGFQSIPPSCSFTVPKGRWMLHCTVGAACLPPGKTFLQFPDGRNVTLPFDLEDTGPRIVTMTENTLVLLYPACADEFHFEMKPF